MFGEALGTQIHSATSTSTRDIVHATRCHAHLVAIGNGTSLSVHISDVIKRVSERMNAASIGKESWFYEVLLAGFTALDSGANLRQTLSAERRHFHLPFSFRASLRDFISVMGQPIT